MAEDNHSKQCGDCGSNLGARGACLPCRRRRYERAHRDSINKKHSEWIASHREQRNRSRALRAQGDPKVSARVKRWILSHPEKRAEARKLHRARYPEKYKCRNAFNNALRNGKVSRPGFCSKCAIECKPHGHHEDYTKPLEVIWLCVKCHLALSRKYA